MKALDSPVPCPGCGEPMWCLLTGPPSQPNTRASYHCDACAAVVPKAPETEPEAESVTETKARGGLNTGGGV